MQMQRLDGGRRMTIKEAIEILDKIVKCDNKICNFCEDCCEKCEYDVSELEGMEAIKIVVNVLKNDDLISKEKMKHISYDFWEDKISRDYVHMFMDMIDELSSGVKNDL